MKLSTLENFLSIERVNPSSGKDMISVYESFLETKDEDLYQELLLHNEDDLKTLPLLMPLMNYLDIFRCHWSLAGYSLNTEKVLLTAVLDCEINVPVSFSYHTSVYTISIRGNQIIVELPVYNGELKYFFSSYQEYDYLPEEDRAVHHKVAQFVDRDHRVKATPATCYTKKTGIFLPMIQLDSMFDLFREEYDSEKLYTEYQENEEFLLSYFRLLLAGSIS